MIDGAGNSPAPSDRVVGSVVRAMLPHDEMLKFPERSREHNLERWDQAKISETILPDEIPRLTK